MMLQKDTDLVMYKAFLAILWKAVRMWYMELQLHSIHCFKEFDRLFNAQFKSNRKQRRAFDTLFTIKQRNNESLLNYISHLDHFNVVMLKIRDLNHSVTISFLRRGLKPCNFFFSLEKRHYRDYAKLLAQPDKYVNAEEAMVQQQKEKANNKWENSQQIKWLKITWTSPTRSLKEMGELSTIKDSLEV